MIIIITGASHTGKTVLAQRMLENYCNAEWIKEENKKNGN